MDIGNQVAGAGIAKRFYMRLLYHGEGNDHPTIITPALFKVLNYSVRDIHGPVIFMGFDCIEPLVIPIHTHIHGDVWFVNCVIRGGKDMVVEGRMHFLMSEFVTEPHRYELHSIDSWTMDHNSWLKYRASRQRQRILGSRGIRLYTDEEQEQRFKAVFHSLPHVDAVPYLEELPSCDLLQNKKDTGYRVEGDVLLCGPYPFAFPDNMTIEGDLILKDHYDQCFPEDLVVQGNISVLTYY